MKPRVLPPLILLAILFLGCGSEEYKTAPVSGRVTLDGNPLVGAGVTFQPVAAGGALNVGPGSFAVTEADGRYTLKLVGKESRGAVVGKHQVRVMPYEAPGDPSDDRPKKTKAPVKVPDKYNKQEAILSFEVPSGGSDKADFALTTK